MQRNEQPAAPTLAMPIRGVKLSCMRRIDLYADAISRRDGFVLEGALLPAAMRAFDVAMVKRY